MISWMKESSNADGQNFVENERYEPGDLEKQGIRPESDILLLIMLHFTVAFT